MGFCNSVVFFKLEDIGSFCEVTDVPVLDFWSRLLWVLNQECGTLLTLGRGMSNKHSLIFTSGATPVDLFMASMVAGHFSTQVGCQI